MDVQKFADVIGADFYTGVPDSQLKPLCDYLMDVYGADPSHHIIGANEGNCAALAAGYFLATGRAPVVYMQNSGEGNIINPLASLLSSQVYAVPAIFVIGWRGEPGVHDEPQHVCQGQITLKLLDDLDVKYFVVSRETVLEELVCAMEGFRSLLAAGKDVAFVVRKGALAYHGCISYKNGYDMLREEAIRHIVNAAGESAVISTTGKISRELFEIRAGNGQSHKYDFLTVGSMGHSSSIAFGVAVHRPDQKVWCIDGDGAALMHMGALAVIGSYAPQNMVHVVLNNGAHESVGGMPTAAEKINLAEVARACGYPYAASVCGYDALDKELQKARERRELTFLEIKCSIGSRNDLGRPAAPPLENRLDFMDFLQGADIRAVYARQGHGHK